MIRTPHSTVLAALIAGALSLAVASGVLAADKTPKAKSEAKAAEPSAAPSADAAKGAVPNQQEAMAMMAKMAAPGPEHAALNPLAGSWKTVTKMWQDPAGAPLVSEGSCERAWVMGGRYMVANYKGDMGGMPFEGMEVLGYDNMKKQYVSSWVDNLGTGIVLSTGAAMDPASHSFTLTGSMPGPTGEPWTAREVTSIVDQNTYTMTMYANDKGQEAKMMEITYTRVK